MADVNIQYFSVYIVEIISLFNIHYLLFISVLKSKNLDEVFTYNHMALMSLPIRSHVKASMVLMRGIHLF